MTDSVATLWTIGHSTRTLDEFVALLQAHRIATLVDVRHYPGSRKFPHFGKEALSVSLPKWGIGYAHILALGGRRPAHKDSPNTRWRSEAFRSYADYMSTPGFLDGIAQLATIASRSRAAICCSEAVWWRCHRSMIADHLKAIGVPVVHILGATTTQEHPYTEPARIVDGRLSYAPEAVGILPHARATLPS